MLVEKEVDSRYIAELLGHKDIRTTQIYSHLVPEHIREAVEKLNEI